MTRARRRVIAEQRKYLTTIMQRNNNPAKESEPPQPGDVSWVSPEAERECMRRRRIESMAEDRERQEDFLEVWEL